MTSTDKERELVLRQLQEVRRLLSVGQRREAFYVLREISHLYVDDWQLQCEFGIRYFQMGALDRSEWSLRQSLSRNDRNAIALRHLSALMSQKGDGKAAVMCAKRSALVEPITGPDMYDEDRPSLLRLRSIEGSYQGITWNTDLKLNECGLRRGHFSTRALINRDQVNLFSASIFGDNLLACRNLPKFDLIVNTVGCADLKSGPLDDVDNFIARNPGIPVINRPADVRKTTRLENAHRLGEIEGVCFPLTVKITMDGTVEAISQHIFDRGLSLPIILREAGTQTGKSVVLAQTAAELKESLNNFAPGTEVYAIQYVDCLGRDGYFHKTRAFFIDGKFFPVANLTSDHWQIHSGDRYRVMDKLPETQKEERRYLNDPGGYIGTGHMDRLHRISEHIGLDFFGIDFTVTPENRLVIFEANPAMRHNFDHAGNFPYTRPFLETVSRSFMAMVSQRIAPAQRRSAS